MVDKQAHEFTGPVVNGEHICKWCSRTQNDCVYVFGPYCDQVPPPTPNTPEAPHEGLVERDPSGFGHGPASDEAMAWIESAYRSPADPARLDEPRFTRWNMVVAYSAGKGRLREGWNECAGLAEYFRHAARHWMGRAKDWQAIADDARKEADASTEAGEEEVARLWFSVAVAIDAVLAIRAALTPPSSPASAEVGEIVERLRKHAPLLQASVFIDAARASLDAADQLERLSSPSPALRVAEEALKNIDRGTDNATEFFKERMGGKRHLTWYAVNVLQEYLAAAQGAARTALATIRAAQGGSNG